MTEQEILGNKLIGEFMGAVYYNDAPEEFPGGYYLEIEGCYPDDWRFHCSWDWLMSAIDKCTQLGYRDIEKGSTINKKWEELLADNYGMFVGAHIDEVYRAAIEFIKWYNANIK